ncbi:MAG: hypothetical protein FWD30_00385 [Dehalococcoidia bacterium]|nr:hypothetical protein [Dehalococcoidia bacterium]
MKSRIAKILGVVLTTLMLVGNIQFAAPVAAGVQKWTDWGNVELPSEENLVLAPNLVKGGPLAQSSRDGKLYAYAQFDNGTDGVDHTIIVSDNHGSTWKRIDTEVRESSTVQYTVLNEEIIGIVCSPEYANVLFIITDNALYRSDNSGYNFTKLVSVAGTGNTIKTFDIGVNGKLPNGNAKHYAVVGVNSFAVTSSASLNNGVYYWEEGDSSNNLKDIGNPYTFGKYDILSVKVTPTFGSNYAIVAVGTNGSTVYVKTCCDLSTWGENGHVSITSATNADIAFPSDYNAGMAESNGAGGLVMNYKSTNFIFCVSGGTGAGIYRIVESETLEKYGNVTGTTPTQTLWMNLSMVGAWGSSTVLVGSSNGQVAKSTSAWRNVSGSGTLASFARQTLADSVTTAVAWVLLDVGFLSGQFGGKDLSYVLNVGGYNGGFSVGEPYIQRSLINDEINFILDLAIAAKGDIFVITTDASSYTLAATNHASMWRRMAAAGGAWERVSVITATGTDVVYDRLVLSPAYGTDNTIYRFKLGGSSSSAVQRSTTNASTGSFNTVSVSTITFASVDAVLPLSNNRVVVAGLIGNSSASSIVTYNYGTSWTAPARTNLTSGRITDLAYALNTNGTTVNTVFAVGVIASPNTVFAYKSTDSGVVWTPFATTMTSGFFSGGTMYDAVITPAADYLDSGNVFVGVNSSQSALGTGAGIYRYTDKPGAMTWTKASSPGYLTNWVRDIVAAPGNGNIYEGSGMIYAIGAETYRVRGAVNGAEAISPNAPTLLGRAAGRYSRLLAVPATSGNVVLYATIGNEIWTYTDTLGRNGDGVNVTGVATDSSSGTSKSSAVISWSLMDYATGYTVKISTVKQTNLYTNNTTGGAVVRTFTTDGNTNYVAVDELLADTTYYVSVWANSPVSSFMFNTAKDTIDATIFDFDTDAGPVIHIYDLTPAAGVAIPYLRPQFAWKDPSTAARKVGRTYTVQVSTSYDFSTGVTTQVVNAIPSNLEMSYTWPTSLTDGNYYYWRVGVNGASGVPSEWEGGYNFRIQLPIPPFTQTQTVLPQPTITLYIPPAQNIVFTNVPPPNVTADIQFNDQNITVTMPVQSTPVYIWVIVGVGALLTLAVVILIIRTRRVV